MNFEQQDRYKKEGRDGDLIDKWARECSREQFRDRMFCQIEKYQDRYGLKDSRASESRKIADYAMRLHQQEIKWQASDLLKENADSTILAAKEITAHITKRNYQFYPINGDAK